VVALLAAEYAWWIDADDAVGIVDRGATATGVDDRGCSRSLRRHNPRDRNAVIDALDARTESSPIRSLELGWAAYAVGDSVRRATAYTPRQRAPRAGACQQVMPRGGAHELGGWRGPLACDRGINCSRTEQWISRSQAAVAPSPQGQERGPARAESERYAEHRGWHGQAALRVAEAGLPAAGTPKPSTSCSLFSRMPCGVGASA
jgi:hypothetical protein